MASSVARFPKPPLWASQLPTIGVTGTNGKTTTTCFVAAALRAGTGAPALRATTVGVFLDDTLLNVEPNYDGFIEAMRIGREAGARSAAIELTSEALAVGFMAAWPVKIGVFTNLTQDHLDAHGSPEHYLASKAQLFVHLPMGGAAVLNGNDSASALLSEVVPHGVRLFFYGVPGRGERAFGTEALDLEAITITPSWEGTAVKFRMENVESGLALPQVGSSRNVRASPQAGSAAEHWMKLRAIGEVYAENALAALGGAMAFGISPEIAIKAIEDVMPPPGRFEVVGERPYRIVDYAHSPDALLRTLVTAKRLSSGRVIVVFGAGGNRDKKKREPMGRAARIADRVIVTTDNPRSEDPVLIADAIREGLVGHGDVTTILDRKKAIFEAVSNAGPDDVVVVSGRGHETEQMFATGARPFSDVDVLRGAPR